MRPGLAIEAPHRGAFVHYEPMTQGGWTSAGRLDALARAPSSGETLPGWVPDAFRSELAAASLAEDMPAALLAAQIEAESGFDPRSVSRSGALGLAQFMPGTWSGSWNPWRAQEPARPGCGDPRTGPLPAWPRRSRRRRPRPRARGVPRWLGRELREGRGRPSRAPTSRRSCAGSEDRSCFQRSETPRACVPPRLAAAVLRLVSLGSVRPKG